MREELVALGVSRDLGAITLGVRLGAILGGRVDDGGVGYAIQPGVVGALSLDWRVLTAPRDPLSLTLGVQLGASHTRVEGAGRSDGYGALDLRASVTASRTLAEVVTPYLSARLFGGPVFWRDATGGDTTHVQLALGVGVEVVPGLTLHVEGAALAERGVFGGVAYAF